MAFKHWKLKIRPLPSLCGRVLHKKLHKNKFMHIYINIYYLDFTRICWWVLKVSKPKIHDSWIPDIAGLLAEVATAALETGPILPWILWRCRSFSEFSSQPVHLICSIKLNETWYADGLSNAKKVCMVFLKNRMKTFSGYWN